MPFAINTCASIVHDPCKRSIVKGAGQYDMYIIDLQVLLINLLEEVRCIHECHRLWLLSTCTLGVSGKEIHVCTH